MVLWSSAGGCPKYFLTKYSIVNMPAKKKPAMKAKKKPSAAQLKQRQRFKQIAQKAKILRQEKPKMTVPQSMAAAAKMLKK